MRCSSGCSCDCCRGIEPVTPIAVWNPPGRDVLETRIGTQSLFYETMRARLSLTDNKRLQQLTVRTTDDPSLALLDGWAVVAEVLTFYQERIANEGYLRTATERRSVHEIGRLIGYAPRPGVAATVHLAYDIDPNAEAETLIEAGAKAQSVPGPGELPQTFETVEPLVARKAWNAIRPRLVRPASADAVENGTEDKPGARLWLQGIATGLKAGDPLIVEITGIPFTFRAELVEPDALADRTRVTLVNWMGERIGTRFDWTGDGEGDGEGDCDCDEVPEALPGSIRRSREIVSRLAVPRSVPPLNSATLARDPDALFAPGAEIGLAAIGAATPRLADALTAALGTASSTEPPPVRVFALRRHSALFAATAPQRVTAVDRETGAITTAEWTEGDILLNEDQKSITLEAPIEKIRPGGWLIVDYSALTNLSFFQIKAPPLSYDNLLVARAGAVQSRVARSAYGITGLTTRIALIEPGTAMPLDWFELVSTTIPVNPTTGIAAATSTSQGFRFVRGLDVLCESEELAIALEPISEPICGGDQWIETDGFYPGLATGRWLLVTGKRADVPGTEDAPGRELAMIGGIRHDAPRVPATDKSLLTSGQPAEPSDERGFAPGESLRTQIRLAAPLSYCYVRDGVAFNANVVKATHGDTRIEPLGSGDASVPGQRFTLRQPPLTFVPANEADGIASTLHVYIDGAEWREADAVAMLGPGTRGFTTETDDASGVTIRFGDGVRGARLPTGLNNVQAVYRSGIGVAGNVRAGQINQLLTRPLGVRGVLNPMEAAGGSDRDPIERMRSNLPLSVAALGRLVSVRDYADFARSFAGIAKAASTRFAVGGSAGVWLTIAGNDDIEIPPDSDLHQMLTRALREFGDPELPVSILFRDRRALLLVARIAIDPAYRWEDVVARVRATLLDRFSFERMALGQSVALSAVTAAIQAQRGVAYVDIDALGAVSAFDDDGARRVPEEVAAAFAEQLAICRDEGPPHHVIARSMQAAAGVVSAAQLVCFAPELTDSLILNRIEQP
jgi:hypothetical protein